MKLNQDDWSEPDELRHLDDGRSFEEPNKIELFPCVPDNSIRPVRTATELQFFSLSHHLSPAFTRNSLITRARILYRAHRTLSPLTEPVRDQNDAADWLGTTFAARALARNALLARRRRGVFREICCGPVNGFSFGSVAELSACRFIIMQI